MAKYAIDGSTLTGIADAIREKSGTTDALLPTDMATAIAAISGGGVELPDGYAMEMGVYTPTEHNYGTAVSIPLKNSYIWDAQTAPAYLFLCGVDHPKVSTGVIGAYCVRPAGFSARRNAVVGNSSSTTTVSTAVIDLVEGDSSNTLQLKGTGTYPLRSGVNYFWLVIGAVAS